MTVHPETAYGGDAGKIIDPILDSLNQLNYISIIMTYSNSDPGGNYINRKKNKFCQINPSKRLIIKSLGYNLYANILKNAKLVLGNSSMEFLSTYSWNTKYKCWNKQEEE